MATLGRDGGDSSVLFNLRELMQIEHDRVQAEHDARAAIAAAELHAREMAARRAAEAAARDAQAREQAQRDAQERERVLELRARLELEAAQRLELARVPQRASQPQVVEPVAPQREPARPWVWGAALLATALSIAAVLVYQSHASARLQALQARAQAATELAQTQRVALDQLREALAAAQDASANKPADAPAAPNPANAIPSAPPRNPRETHARHHGKAAAKQPDTDALESGSDPLDDESADPLLGL